MKMKLVEDLEADLKAAAAEKDVLRKEIANIFKGTDFQEKKNVNGISYNATKDAIEASFYIDDQISYNGYVYDGADYNLQVEGDVETVIDSAKNILDNYNNIQVDTEVEDELVDDAIDDVIEDDEL